VLKKVRKRIGSSFLFKDRCLGMSISDLIIIGTVMAVGIYFSRHLNVGF
jgi:hypothetical protein